MLKLQNYSYTLKYRNIHTGSRNFHTCNAIQRWMYTQSYVWITACINCVVCLTPLLKYVMISSQI